VQKLDGETFIETDVCPHVGDAILDLGCGTGELSVYLAELVGPEGKVIAVDPDKGRIQLARQSHSGIKNLSFEEGSAANFPGIGSKSYDIIFCNLVLHWISDKEQVFKSMFDSLKVGGRIAIQYGDDPPPFLFKAFKELSPPENAERIFQMFQYEWKAKNDQSCSLAGFEIVSSYETLGGQFVFENTEELLKWLWSTTLGVFDPSLVTKERLQRYLASYTNEDGKTACLDLRGVRRIYYLPTAGYQKAKKRPPFLYK